jgi:1,5-anhydro-D-fructose reductase (1,5-anhydro-D-mannitol-forming)
MIRVAVLGFWHVHAKDYAGEATAHPGTEIVAAWDDDPDRGRERAAALGVPFHDDLDALLAGPDVDGVIVTTATTEHPAVIGAAAEAGKHVFTEKVLALTPAECRKILDGVERAGVRLTVSLPRLAHGYTRAIRAQIDDGALGRITLVRTRLAHDGALDDGWLPTQFFDLDQAGGGALVDLGCHPMYLARLFLGAMPARITARYGHLTGREVEDNAVAVLESGDGSLAVVEAGFVSRRSPFSIEVHGTDASLFYGTPEPRLMIAGADGRWTDWPIPVDGPSPFEQWVEHIERGTTADENIALALDLTTLMDAAARSARTGEAIQFAQLA